MSCYRIFGSESCGWCRRARQMLEQNRCAYEFHAMETSLYRSEYAPLVPAHHTTKPQIFLGHHFIGGYDELTTHFQV